MIRAGHRMSILIALGLIAPIASYSGEYKCSVTDPANDVADDSTGLVPEPYQDIVRAAVERGIGALTFSMEVSAPVPSAPLLMNPGGLLLWMWGLNTDQGAPQGYPLAPGNAGLLEFWVHLAWDGTRFFAEVIDRRPALVGGQPSVTSVPFVIDGRMIRVIAPDSLFDDPPVFRWGSTTWLWSSPLGTSGGHPLDRAPDEHVTTCSAN